MTDAPTPLVFEELYTRDYRSLVTFAYSQCSSWPAAEELAQEAFVAAYRDWDRIAEYAAPEAWLRRAVANRTISGWRRRASEGRALARVAGNVAQTATLDAGIDKEFWAAVRALPRRQAQAVALHYLEDRSVEDIAEILELSPSTVRVHLHRARVALAATVGCTTTEEEVP